MLLPPFHNGFVPRTVPVPALRPCLTCTAFSLPWYARPLCCGVLALLLRRVSSPVMGIQLSRCFFGFVTVFFIDNPQSSC